MRIAYFGLPLGALCLARSGHRALVVCVGHTDALGMRRLRRTLGATGTLVLGRPDLEDASIRRVLAAARPDVILSWFWPRRIPASVLELAPRGAFGVHPSLLPRWRGPDPYYWAIRAADGETGVTLHRLEESYDTGAIVAQRVVPVDVNDDAWRLAKKLDRPGLALLVEAAQRLAQGERLEGQAQDTLGATDAPSPSPEDLAVRWSDRAEDIVRLVRAAAPLGASAQIGEHTVDILRARAADAPILAALEPAEAVRVPDGVMVRAADRGVVLEVVRTEDDAVLRGAAVGSLL